MSTEQPQQQSIRVLFVDDQEEIRCLFSAGMRSEDIQLDTAVNGEDALKVLAAKGYDLVVTDVRMPVMDGIALLKAIKERYPRLFVVILTAHGTIEDAVKAMRLGAYDYILKPFDFSTIHRLIAMVNEHRMLLGENAESSEDTPYRFENIIGQDVRMFEVFHQIKTVASSMATVLITGESGTGKELVAHAIHSRSDRHEKPFIAVNCGAFADTLIQSELFGHEKGAFTGAGQRRSGHFEMANGGTIFLDEIADTSPDLQKTLLRLLESGSFFRVGGTSEQHTNVRIIAATNKDMVAEVLAGRFRKDLYYRLKVVSLELPPLRERRKDIPLLVEAQVRRIAREEKRKVVPCSPETMIFLLNHSWPGNVRELVNVLRNAIIFCDKEKIMPGHLPREILNVVGPTTLALNTGTLAEAEAALIRGALECVSGNLSLAAEKLGIARGTLYSKMGKYGIQRYE
ncbi:MAG: two-component system NtrC family response regulator [Desulfobulbaceae bacterium]|nr:MAG: two-component system NtrC family response regulator [Desulfobulbaceae bacterium]